MLGFFYLLLQASKENCQVDELERAAIDALRRERAAAGPHQPVECPQAFLTCPHLPSGR